MFFSTLCYQQKVHIMFKLFFGYIDVAPCKGIQDTLGFWIPRRGLRIPITGFQIFFSRTWIPDSNCQWDSGFLHLYSGFQGPGFRIPQAKISKIPDSKCKNFPDSGIRIPLHRPIDGLWLFIVITKCVYIDIVLFLDFVVLFYSH